MADATARRLLHSSSVEQIVESLHCGSAKRCDLLELTRLAVLGESENEEHETRWLDTNWSWEHVTRASRAVMRTPPLIREDAEAAGMQLPNVLPYVALLAYGSEPAHRLMNAVLGLLELEQVLAEKTPPRFRDNTQVLATDALVVVMSDGLPAEVASVGHGSGQMPHHLCLNQFTHKEWKARVSAGDADTRLPYGKRSITLQAAMCRGASLETRACMFSFDRNGGGADCLMPLLRALFVHVLCMFSYYMDARHSEAAFGTVYTRGLHSNGWFRNALRRFKGAAFAEQGLVVGYADALCYTSVGWDTEEIDTELWQSVRLSVTPRPQDDDVEDVAESHGWLLTKGELTRATSRARWLFMEMLGTKSILLNDGDGSLWQLQQLHYGCAQGHTEPRTAFTGMRDHLDVRPRRRDSTHVCFRHTPAMPASAPPALTWAVWEHCLELASFGNRRGRVSQTSPTAEHAAFSLPSSSSTDPLTYQPAPAAEHAAFTPPSSPNAPLTSPITSPSVRSIVLYLLKTRVSKWHGTLGRLRGVVMMHAIHRSPHKPRKIVVAVHKTVPGGFGHALWGPALCQQRIATLIVRSVALVEPRMLGKLPTLVTPPSTASFTPTDLQPLSEVLREDELTTTMSQLGLESSALHILRPHCLAFCRHTEHGHRYDCPNCDGGVYECPACDKVFCAVCDPGPCNPESVIM